MPYDPNMRVLVVDDFATMRRIVKNILRQLGFNNVVEADDGTSDFFFVLSKLEENNFESSPNNDLHSQLFQKNMVQ